MSAAIHTTTVASVEDRDRLAYILAMHLLHFERQRRLTAIVAPTWKQARDVWDMVAAIATTTTDLVRRISRTRGGEDIETTHGARLICADGAKPNALRGVTVDRLILLSSDWLTTEQRTIVIPSVFRSPDPHIWEINVAPDRADRIDPSAWAAAHSEETP